jgi:multidrug efflux system membrane fusion protein
MFDNKQGTLYPNQFVNTRLLVETQNNMTLIPTNAIQHNGDVSFVYAIANGTAKMQNVKPGTANEGLTAVTGINPGDMVATSSFEKLLNGSKVNIAKTPPAATGASESNAP